MTTSQIITRDDQVLARFGQHEVPVPDSLGRILTDLIRNGRSHTGTGSPITIPWLFPGGMPGRPITPSRLGERLRALGVRAMPGRRAALIDLAAQLPAAVLADSLNLSPGTAVRWMHQAGADWNPTPPTSPDPAITNPDEYPDSASSRLRHSTWLEHCSLPVSMLAWICETSRSLPATPIRGPRCVTTPERARGSLDRHPNYILAAYMASGT